MQDSAAALQSKPQRVLRVLWISHLVPYPPKGGVLMRSNYLISELARHHTVDLLALNQSKLLGSYYESNEAGLKAARSALAPELGHMETFEFESQGKRSLAVKSLFSRLPYSVGWFTSEEFAGAIKHRLDAEAYEVVHFDTVGLAQYRHLVRDIPTVLDHHNIESHMMLRRAQKESNPAKKLYFYQEGIRLRQYEKAVLPTFDGHITCSDVDGQRLRELSPDTSVQAIPNSVRVDPAFLPGERKGRRLLFIGGMDWYPNRSAVTHFIRQIWPLIAEQNREVEAHFIGKNPGEELTGLAGGHERIHIHGFVDDITSFYRDSDIFVCPINDGGGTKLKVLDAMAHYLPIVGYPEACEGIEVKDGKHALIAHNPHDFANKVVGLLANPQAARSMGEHARKLVAEKYEAGKVGENLSKYYTEVAQKL